MKTSRLASDGSMMPFREELIKQGGTFMGFTTTLFLGSFSGPFL